MTCFRLLAATVLSLLPAANAQQPLPFLGPNSMILFEGDSITDGGRMRTGSDFNHIMGQDYGYILAAEIGYDSPERNLNFVNRGIGGDRVLDMAARWQADTLALHPNLLSILIGVNDTLASGDKAETLDQYRTTYDKLLHDTLAADPGVKIVLGEPFLLPVGNYKAAYATWMVEVQKRQQVVDELGAKYHLPVIHYQNALNAALAKAPAEHWSWDGVHPTYAGHALMAAEWLNMVDKAWGKAGNHAASQSTSGALLH